MAGLIRALVNFPSAELETNVLRDAAMARDLTARCERALVYGPGTPRQRMKMQLRDAFGIDVSAWNENVDEAWDRVAQIRERFAQMRSLLPQTTIRFDKVNPREMEEEPQAWVSPDEPRVIHVLADYFSLSGDDERSRAAKLIHELVHSLNALYPSAPQVSGGEDRAHPGMMQGDYYAREKYQEEPLGIPFDKACRNAYCYQYFTVWLNGISLATGIRGRRRP